MKHKHFNVNTEGRDFVVGDLHGSLDLLTKFLREINFDSVHDRMFSVGDLVDRGPNSLGCLQLLEHDWFHCVKSNHEQLMEDFLTGGPAGSWWMPNGGSWWNFLTVDERRPIIDDLLPTVQALPWMITVDMIDGKRFHVIHAEILGEEDEILTDADLDDPAKFLDVASRIDMDGHGLLWGRDIFGELFGKDITNQQKVLHKTILAKRHATDFFNPELSHIFSGHTPMREPTTVHGQTNLDTMAFATGTRNWAGLTVAEPLTGKFWKTNLDGTKEVPAVVL